LTFGYVEVFLSPWVFDESFRLQHEFTGLVRNLAIPYLMSPI